MEITLHQLRVFVKVSELGSITKAAEFLHLTQPAISIQLKNLQEQFPFPLTEVIGRQLYTTEFGQTIYQKALEILYQIQSIEDTTQQLMGHLSGTLRVGSVSTGKYVVPSFVSNFLQSHPAVNLSMDVTNRSGVIQSLMQNETDLGFITSPPASEHLVGVELMPNKLVLVCGKQSGVQNWRDLFENHHLPYILRENGSSTRELMEAFVSQFRNTQSKRIELTSNEAVKQAVIANMGWSMMPLIGLKHELLCEQIRVLPCKELISDSHWHVIWLRDKKFSPVAASFLNYLKEEKDDLVRNLQADLI
jgi:DNA-binding transcriptional LysR family regulator